MHKFNNGMTRDDSGWWIGMAWHRHWLNSGWVQWVRIARNDRDDSLKNVSGLPQSNSGKALEKHRTTTLHIQSCGINWNDLGWLVMTWDDEHSSWIGCKFHNDSLMHSHSKHLFYVVLQSRKQKGWLGMTEWLWMTRHYCGWNGWLESTQDDLGWLITGWRWVLQLTGDNTWQWH